MFVAGRKDGGGEDVAGCGGKGAKTTTHLIQTHSPQLGLEGVPFVAFIHNQDVDSLLSWISSVHDVGDAQVAGQ